MIEKIFERYKYFFLTLSIFVAFLAQQALINEYFLISVFLFCFSIGIMLFSNKDFKASGLNIKPNSINNVQVNKKKVYFFSFTTVFSAFLSIVFFFTEDNQIAWIFHVLSLVLFLVLIGSIDTNSFKTPKKFTVNFKALTPILIILLIGVFVRTYQLDQMPFGLWYDEADFGLNAKKIIQEDSFAPVFFENSRVPAYYIYFLAFSIQIFGSTMFALRIVSAIFGVFTIIVGYLCAREMFNHRIAIVFAFFIAVSRWNINWSRIGLDNITIPFFELLVVYLLYLAISKKRFLLFALAGIALGLGLSFYASMRIFPLVLLIWLLANALFNKRFIMAYWKEGVVFCMAVILSILPMAQYAITNPEPFWGRVNQTSIFNGKSTQEAWIAIAETTKEHLLMFNYQGDRNGRHNLSGKPMLDAVTASLMVLGLGLSLFRFKYPKYLLIFSWWLIMLIPGIFSLDFESPQSLRAIGSLPAAYLLAIVPVNELIRHEKLLIKKNSKLLFQLMFTLLLVIAAFNNINTYFNLQMKSSSSWLEFSTRETIIANRMNEIGTNADYFISSFYYNAPTVKYLAPEINTIQKFETYDLLPLDQLGEKKAILILDGDRKPFFDSIRENFPDAEFRIVKDPNGIEILYEAILSPAVVQKNQGLSAQYYSGEMKINSELYANIQKGLSFSWDDKNLSDEITRVEWEGVLFIPDQGQYRFYYFNEAQPQLYIDQIKINVNSTVDEESSIFLAKGNHAIKIIVEDLKGNFDLQWQPQNGTIQPINLKNLYHPSVIANGLLSSYYSSLDWSGPVVYSQIDPQIDFYYHNQPVPRPYSVEWKGIISVPKEGEYIFILTSRDASNLFINNDLLISNPGYGDSIEQSIYLNEGKYPIRIQFIDQTGYTFITLEWVIPGQEKEIIPSKYFSLH